MDSEESIKHTVLEEMQNSGQINTYVYTTIYETLFVQISKQKKKDKR